ncbi:hypothetical protein EUGRSUZ_F00878 [Eucalyptus grandis]|uniref:Uncharacterized protein n=2 Tax=Eucalyptus grandis TaxID=71139 RepID=A0ACC3KC93_EUCGR|nr:hypothetical protein EUGRSUZ_F00878 [Eucalyptus grandis]
MKKTQNFHFYRLKLKRVGEATNTCYPSEPHHKCLIPIDLTPSNGYGSSIEENKKEKVEIGLKFSSSVFQVPLMTWLK